MGRTGDTKKKKLVLVVIDAMSPTPFAEVLAAGGAPALQAVFESGASVDCIAPFPSLTPVCSATIATGYEPDVHTIPAMNWYSRQEARYVEYGTSFRASQAFGLRRSLVDLIFNLNLEHLSSQIKTVFEELDDHDVRTAGTTFLMYRGRYRHNLTRQTPLLRLAATLFAALLLARASFSMPTSSLRKKLAVADSSVCQVYATNTPVAPASSW